MKQFRLAALAVAVVTFALAQNANAQDYNKYWGVGIGGTDADQCTSVSRSCDDTDTGAKAFFGIKIQEQLAFETGYAYHGETRATSGSLGITYDMGSLYGVLAGTIPVGERVELFGKAGVHFWSFEASNFGSRTASDTDNGVGLYVGAGGDIKINDRNSVRLEYDFFYAEPSITFTSGEATIDYDVARFNVSYVRWF